MKTINRLLIFTLFCMVSVSALQGDVKYGEPVEGKLRTGLFRDKLVDPETGDLIIEFWLSVPKKLPKDRHLGTVVYFYGAGGGASDNWWGGNPPHYLRKLGVEHDYIYISPRSKGNGWGKTDLEPASKLLEWVTENYPIDKRRVYCYGFSSGGFFLDSFAIKNKDSVAGCVAAAGRIRSMTKEKDAAEKGQEFYFMCGTNDGHKSGSHASIQQAKITGHRYIYRQVDGVDHNGITNHDPVLTDGFMWLNTLRHKNMEPSEQDAALIAELKKEAAQSGLWSDAAKLKTLARIGGREAGEVIIEALQKGNSEVRIKAAQFCVDRMFSITVVEELAGLLYTELTDEEYKAVCKALSSAARWRFSAAQEGLRKASLNRREDQMYLHRAKLDKKRPMARRLIAIEALADSIELQLLGWIEDRTVWETFTDLLIDPTEETRTAAIDVLKKIIEGGHGYRPELKPQQNARAIKAWRDWLDKNCKKVKKKRR